MAKADESIRAIIKRMAERIRTLDRTNYDGSCFLLLDKQLSTAKNLALTNMDNTLGTPSCAELDYVQMREFQSQVLRQIYNSIQMIAYLPDQAPIIADFFERISKEYAKTNDVKSLLDTLHELILSMKNEKLPTKREEFESRAVLFYILKQLEEFFASLLRLTSSFVKIWLTCVLTVGSFISIICPICALLLSAQIRRRI